MDARRGFASFPTRRSSDLRSDREPADFLRRCDVAVQQRRREISDRHIVEALTGVVFRQQLFGIDNVTVRSEEHTSELQSREKLVCRLLLEKKKHSHVG